MIKEDIQPLPAPAYYLEALEDALADAPHIEPGQCITYTFCHQEIYIPTGVELSDARISAMFNILHFIGYAQQVSMSADKDFKRTAQAHAIANAEEACAHLSAAGALTDAEAVNHYGMHKYLGRLKH